MAEEQKPGEMPKNEQAAVMDAPTEQPTETVEQLRARLAEREKQNRELGKENAMRRQRLEQLEAEAKAQQEAGMSELQKAQKKLAELEAEIQRRDMDTKKRAIAAKVGLPDPLALRLVGTTDEELEQDAKTLLETLPKPEKPKTWPVNPGAGGTTGEAEAERRRRLLS